MYQDGAMPFPEDWYVGRHIGLQSWLCQSISTRFLYLMLPRQGKSLSFPCPCFVWCLQGSYMWHCPWETTSNYMQQVFIPVGCTGELQPLDVRGCNSEGVWTTVSLSRPCTSSMLLMPMMKKRTLTTHNIHRWDLNTWFNIAEFLGLSLYCDCIAKCPVSGNKEWALVQCIQRALGYSSSSLELQCACM